MSKVQIKCPFCSANLKVYTSQESATCLACDTNFILGKFIAYRSIQNQISANKLKKKVCFNNEFEIVNGVLTKYKGVATNVVIPSDVLMIGENVFSGCTTITSVSIPDSLIEIGEKAFYQCENLRNIELPRTLNIIGPEAFSRSGLESVDIPSSVSIVSVGAFSYCNNLKSVNIGANTIDLSAFRKCENLSSVVFLSSVQEIYYLAFAFCTSLKKIVLPESIVSFNHTAFAFCKDLTVMWPSTFRKRQVTKLLTALCMLDDAKASYYYSPCYLEYRQQEEYRTYLTKQVIYDGKQNNVYLFRDGLYPSANLITVENASNSDEFSALDVKFKELLDLVSFAGIEESAIRRVITPVYSIDSYGNKKQVDSEEVLTIQLTEELQ